MLLSILTVLSLNFLFSKVYGACPFITEGTPLAEDLPASDVPSETKYNKKLKDLDIYAVFDKLYTVMNTTQSCFPPDEFNGESSYAGLFIRLAWHCAGTYRTTDGLGGCAGGRMRYSPENSWADNVNLDKARAILYPVKEKFGDALSWGDLMIFAGEAAFLAGGMPRNTICAGRIDDADGTNSDDLNMDSYCNANGENCTEPQGSSTLELIYVNPQGVFGNPDPAASAVQIRKIFGRMGMNDSETVALIGGGHAFGKAHGACPDGPGDSPNDAPTDPWPGNCGSDFPDDVTTSGIEGQWTTNPFTWDNEYFTQLVEDNYTLITGSGGKYQWENNDNGYLMLTTDLAFLYDDDYLAIVNDYASDISILNRYFNSAWNKLTTSPESGFADNKFCVDASELAPAVVADNIKSSDAKDITVNCFIIVLAIATFF